jgi:hypothetical protein
MYWRGKSFDLLPLVTDTVHLTQYTFSETRGHYSSIDVPFLNTCLTLAGGMQFFSL